MSVVGSTPIRLRQELFHKAPQSQKSLVGLHFFRKIYDAAAGLRKALVPLPPAKHHAAITDPQEVGGLLRALDEYGGRSVSVMYALRIMPYVFLRSEELRGAYWAEINLKAAEWIVPAGSMKMKRPHIVPLARQVVALLEALREYSGGMGLVFPCAFSASRCISDLGLLNALRRMGTAKKI